jgi:cell wall-associated NlpC family hydrolase
MKGIAMEIHWIDSELSEAELRKMVVEEAKTWQFTPSRHRGAVKGKEGGVDCGSFIFCVFVSCGIIWGKLPENYSPQWWAHRENHMYIDEIEKYCEEKPDLPERTPKPGDIILFQYGRSLGHGAIVIDYPYCIHLHPKAAEVHIDRLDTSTVVAGRDRHVYAIKGWE